MEASVWVIFAVQLAMAATLLIQVRNKYVAQVARLHTVIPAAAQTATMQLSKCAAQETLLSKVTRVAKQLVWSTATSKARKLAAMVTFQLEPIKIVAVMSVSMPPHTFAAQAVFWLRVTHAARNKVNPMAKFMVLTIPRRPAVTVLLSLVCSLRAAVKPVYQRMPSAVA